MKKVNGFATTLEPQTLKGTNTAVRTQCLPVRCNDSRRPHTAVFASLALTSGLCASHVIWSLFRNCYAKRPEGAPPDVFIFVKSCQCLHAHAVELQIKHPRAILAIKKSMRMNKRRGFFRWAIYYMTEACTTAYHVSHIFMLWSNCMYYC